MQVDYHSISKIFSSSLFKAFIENDKRKLYKINQLNAVGQLNVHNQNNPFTATSGRNHFIQTHNNQSFHGLGKIKRNSMIHHLELIHSVI